MPSAHRNTIQPRALAKSLVTTSTTSQKSDTELWLCSECQCTHRQKCHRPCSELRSQARLALLYSKVLPSLGPANTAFSGHSSGQRARPRTWLSQSGSAVHWDARVHYPRLAKLYVDELAQILPRLGYAHTLGTCQSPPQPHAPQQLPECAAKLHTAPSAACQERRPVSSHAAAPVRASELGYWLAPSCKSCAWLASESRAVNSDQPVVPAPARDRSTGRKDGDPRGNHPQGQSWAPAPGV